MLTQLLAKAYADHPEKTAIVCGDTRISYQELYSKVEGLSRGLDSIGVSRGDCVALLLPNCPEFVVGFWAIARLNGVVLPLNHLFKVEEITHYLADSNVKVIITDSGRAELCQQAFSNLDQVIELIVVDRIYPAAKYFDHLIVPGNTEQASPANNDNVLYQYSSGSTGRPKRIGRTQSNLYHEAQNFAETANIVDSDRILCAVPLYHAHGLGNCLLAATCNGATLVILEQSEQNGEPVEVPFVFKVPRIFDLIKTEKITIFPGVPYIFKAMAQYPTSDGANLSGLRLCFSAGNFLEKEIFDQFLKRFDVSIRQLYGCTEAGAVCINLDQSPQNTWNSVGTPLKNVEVKIVDEYGRGVEAETVGELVIKSSTLTRGYDNLPQLNQQAFKDGAFLTGDLGKLDAEGRVYITGRKKILIDTGGRKVDPIEIEDILATHPKVKEAVVVGVKIDSGEIVKAVIVTDSPQFQEQEIFSFCKNRLAEFKVPKMIEFRDEIPKSPLGKVLRKHLV